MQNPRYCVGDSGGLLFERFNPEGDSESRTGVDYIVVKAGRQFTIPDETLGIGGELSADALDEWESFDRGYPIFE
ncbi:hypothetical protein [Thiocapsa bogorovii]|uniref:hypothetical protein n=1 Tax=Thiocapsa bogorovii TaxID=521689 RepID=UPI001E4E83A0|nr:hypothetical protein [Thiocapsa bogorovii]UHD15177.1 hypothetical protein LT988_18120 [Thiocapsa bogorovii]